MITLDNLDLQKLTTEEIGEILIEAKKAYYTGGKPTMNDHTYDTLEEILRQKNPYHRIFSKIGHANFDTGFPKKKHIMPMGSQNKVSNYSDLVHYFELKKIPQNTEFVVQPKCDGLSLELVYQKGQIQNAITRGDGKIGDIITQNVIKMKNFLPKLKQEFSGSIRCEIVVTKTDFRKLNKEITVLLPKENYSNPRNAASGISQRLDSKFSEFCTLIAVDLVSADWQFGTEIQQIETIKKLGIEPVETHLCQNFSEIENIFQEFLRHKRQDYDFDIDGLVIKINDQKLQQKLGYKNQRPKGQVAYKFPSLSSQTKLISVNWQTGPMGTVTPVAQVEPVLVSGAVITFASLANFDLIKQLNVNIGDIVEISRRGDVIPHIEKVINKVNPGHLTAPDKCPSCQTPLIVESKFLKCPNSGSCPSQILGILRLFCSTLGIKGISLKTIQKLHASGVLKLPGDFYKLKIDNFKDLDGLGEKSGNNIIHQIQSKKILTLQQIFAAAAIPDFSSARIQQLINAGFDTPQKILNLKVSDLEALVGFQNTLATKIIEGIALRQDIIQSILGHVTLKTSDTSQHLQGLTFVITGKLSRPRQDITNELRSLGAAVSSSVSQNTDYLISNETETNSSKYKTAQKLGIKIINETQLAQMILSLQTNS